ncbi:juvenile hormone acid methyltransferase [Calliopsis andreniformis]|uniref:juvenile hormone acid methyltransferase n=1 Tax=Calliopsis andreniformis TaxID=337506 RepID=UPI003FCCE71C
MHKPEMYANRSKLQYLDAKDIVEEFEKELSEMEGKCIDIGCGPGNVTMDLILRRLSPEVELVGVDISQSMIDYARQKYSDEKRLSFMQLDIETTNLSNELVGQYSNLFSFYCFHWCKDVRLAFENTYKLLRPGGKALIMFLGWNDGFDAYARLPTYSQYKPYTQDALRYVPFFHRCKDSRIALRQMLEEIGFEVLHCSRRERSYIYQNLDIFKDYVLAVNPFTSRVPENLKEDFNNDLSREVASRKIHFRNNIDNDQQEYSILDIYHILVAYLRKPVSMDGGID